MRQISESRTAQERLEEELQRKDQQISILMKQVNGSLKQEADAELKQLRTRLAESEDQISDLKTQNAQHCKAKYQIFYSHRAFHPER